MGDNVSKRTLLCGLGTSLAAGLAGCTVLTGSDSNSGDSDESDSTDIDNRANATGTTESSDSSGSDGDVDTVEPTDSRYVEDGELTVRPFVDVFGVVRMDDSTVDLLMTAMPNPLGDYEIGVYYTPLADIESEWVWQPVRTSFYGGGVPQFDSTDEQWVVTGGHHAVPVRKVAEHGRQIGSITVPSAAAGLLSDDVTDPMATNEVDVTVEEFQQSQPGEPAYEEVIDYVTTQIPDLGDQYPTLVKQVVESEPSFSRQFGRTVGSWISGTGPSTPPFIRSVNVDVDVAKKASFETPNLGQRIDETRFPEQAPFVLTFGVDDPNAAYNDPAAVVTQTPQVLPTARQENVVTPQVLPGEETSSTTLQRDWTHMLPYGRAERGAWKRAYDDDVYQTVDYYDGDDRVLYRASRLTNYGRYSPKLEQLSQEILASDSPVTYSPAQLVPTQTPTYFDSPIQSAWSIEYTVTRAEMEKAQRTANEIKRTTDEVYTELAIEARDHPVVQSIADDLRDVCDRLNTSHPTEEVTVLANFVQYITHIAVDNDPPEGADVYGFGTRGPQHPLWTLYHATGDCQDFTVLMNALLRTEQFGYTPSAGWESDTGFSRRGSDIGHVSTTIPVTELGITDVMDDAHIEFAESGGVNIEDNKQYTYDGQKYAYVELSGPFPIGTAFGLYTESIDPSPIEERQL